MPISAITAADAQYPMMVNGYLCYSAADVRSARQFTNPDKDGGAAKAAAAAATTLHKQRATFQASTTYDAVGSVSGRDEGRASASTLRGRNLDIWA